MKINEYNGAMKWITRKKPSNKERADVLQWIDYNNGVHGTEAQHKEYKKKYATVANKYDESEDPRYIDPKEVDAIKKTLVVEKPKPKPKPPIINLLELEDWLNKWDNNCWDEEEEHEPGPWDEKVLLQVPRSELKGIASILNLHKKFSG